MLGGIAWRCKIEFHFIGRQRHGELPPPSKPVTRGVAFGQGVPNWSFMSISTKRQPG